MMHALLQRFRVRTKSGGWCKRLQIRPENGRSRDSLNNQPGLGRGISHWTVRTLITGRPLCIDRGVFTGNFLYTLHELANTLTSQELPAAPNGTSTVISSFSIIPPDAPEGSSFGAAEILLPSPNDAFPGRYVYVSNRNIGTGLDERGDTIAIFSASETGELALMTHIYTGLQQIRGMQIGGPDDRFLIAGGNTAGGVAMFERAGDGGDLQLLARNNDLPTRTSFVFFDAAQDEAVDSVVLSSV